MKRQAYGLRAHIAASLFCSIILLGNFVASAADNATLVSVSVTNGTPMMPRTIFTQTWTFKNTGTTTWTPGRSGYSLNMTQPDTLGAIPLTVNTLTHSYEPVATIGSGASVPPGGQASYSMNFIVPEAPGTYTDTLQLNSASSVYFGPLATVQIVALPGGSTNQYDRSMAISYANNYAGYIVSDGYFWTNGSDCIFFGAGSNVPTAYLGDDCAHFVSCCIGTEPNHRGGGLKIPSRALPSYGEPGAQRLIYTVLVSAGYATEVSSLSQLSPGDLIGWNWEGDTSTNNIDHVTLYLGNGLTASHAESALDVSANTFFQSGEPNWKWHLIHIFDAPTMNSSTVGTNLILSWGTNWTGYALYSSTSLDTNATWTKMTKSPTKIGSTYVMTNGMSSGSRFYRLTLP